VATWTTIPDANLEPDKPARSIDALALRDNPVAIAEGAAGAPKIDILGLENGDIAAGDAVSWKQSGLQSTTQTSYLSAGVSDDPTASIGIRVYCEGTVRIDFTHYSTGPSESSIVRILKNDIQIIEFTNTGTTHATQTYDIAVVFGDIIGLQQKSSFYGEGAAWFGLRISGDIKFMVNSPVGV